MVLPYQKTKKFKYNINRFNFMADNMTIGKVIGGIVLAGAGTFIIPAVANGFISNLNTTYPEGHESRYIYTVVSLIPPLAILGMWFVVLKLSIKALRG